MICASSAQRGWHMLSADVSMAFLKGLTFEEQSQLEGSPKRVVFCELPRGGADILRNLPEFAGFNPACEILEVLKGGFGLEDAPRLWTSKVHRIFISYKWLPTHGDDKMYLKHRSQHSSDECQDYVEMTGANSARMDAPTRKNIRAHGGSPTTTRSNRRSMHGYKSGRSG